jgi:hypothetical protein
LYYNTSFKDGVINPTLPELIHCTTLNTLKQMYANIKNKLVKLEAEDEFDFNGTSAVKIGELRDKKDFLYLLIKYKMYKELEAETAKEKARLQKEIAELKESTKSPEQRIAEMEVKLNSL